MKSLTFTLATLTLSAANPIRPPPTETDLAPVRHHIIERIDTDPEDGTCTSVKFIQPGFTFGPLGPRSLLTTRPDSTAASQAPSLG